jgi:DNA polymerase (family 10)
MNSSQQSKSRSKKSPPQLSGDQNPSPQSTLGSSSSPLIAGSDASRPEDQGEALGMLGYPQDPIELLEQWAEVSELLGENRFKVQAYQRVAQSLAAQRALWEQQEPLKARPGAEVGAESFLESLRLLAKAGRLREISGVGAGIEQILNEFLLTGRSLAFEDLRRSVPAGLFELSQVPGLGPKKAAVVLAELGIRSWVELEYACQENRLAHLKGFGPKLQKKILEGVQFLAAHRGMKTLGELEPVRAILLEELRRLFPGRRIEETGALRRKLEVLSQLEYLMELHPNEAPSQLLGQPGLDQASPLPSGQRAQAQIDSSSSFRDVHLEGPFCLPALWLDQSTHPLLQPFKRSSWRIQLHFATQANWGTRWITTTGSWEHLSELAAELSSGLEAAPLSEKKPAKQSDELAPERSRLSFNFEPWASEQEFYAQQKLPWIPPECREGGLHFPSLLHWARQGGVASLVGSESHRVRGVFHNHTTASDGSASLEEMAARALELGYEYLGVSDHSVSAHYARGLSLEALREQKKELLRVQKKYPQLKLFFGIESDILADGSLDYPDEVLAEFDFVIASIHSRFQMDRAAMTERLLRAIRNPFTSFIGHVTGRLLLGRKGYEVDLEAVIREAQRHHVAIELNCNPARLDLDWRWGPLMSQVGTLTSLHPDAHDLAGLEDTQFGVWMARKGRFPFTQILNTRSAQEVELWLKNRRSARQ